MDLFAGRTPQLAASRSCASWAIAAHWVSYQAANAGMSIKNVCLAAIAVAVAAVAVAVASVAVAVAVAVAVMAAESAELEKMQRLPSL